MTEGQWATMWKEAIEKSLAEENELRERLRPVEFSSDLWNVFRGAYGDVREDVAFLFCPKELMPEMEKVIRLDFEEKECDQINFDNLCENLSHQLSFYNATYLAMPYLLLFLEKKRKEKDVSWQMQIILQAGIILSTDFHLGKEGRQGVSEDILESYQLSVGLLREMAKEFLQANMQALKHKDPTDLKYFCTGLLAIFGDPGAAYQLVAGGWEQAPVACVNCGYFDEDMEADGLYDEELVKGRIDPAEPVCGKWDGKDFSDSYLWLSNLAHILGIEDAWKIPYYYGTYTCPECGSKGILMDWMKKYEE